MAATPTPRGAREFSLPRLSLTLACLLGAPAVAQAGPSFLGPSLPPGSPYRLIFVTSDSTIPTSTDIGTYNNFATTEAMLNGGLPKTTWSAIVSTETTNAVDNLGAACTGACLTAPIYLVDGTTLIANNQAQLFSGTLLNAIDEDENGNTTNGYVWTGSNASGTAQAGFSFTSSATHHAMGDRAPATGLDTSVNHLAFSFGFVTAKSGGSTHSLPLYVISGQLTVPASTPEPMSGSLLLMGGAASGLVRRLRRRRPH